MSDLQQRPTPSSRPDHLVRFGKCPGDGLLHQHVDAGFQQATSYFAMRLGWDRQANSFHAADQFAPVRRPIDFFRSDVACGLLVEIANECKLRQAFGGEIRMYARVLPAEMAHAYDCGAKWHMHQDGLKAVDAGSVRLAVNIANLFVHRWRFDNTRGSS
jgi:hypothetical protein